jgi:hypothetical protein
VVEHRPADGGSLWLWIHGKAPHPLDPPGSEPDRRVLGIQYGQALDRALAALALMQADLTLDNYIGKYSELQEVCPTSIIAYEQFDWETPADRIPESYGVTLLFAGAISLDADRLWQHFASANPSARRSGPTEFTYDAHSPARLVVGAGRAADHDLIRPSFQQTFDWPNLGETMNQVTWAIDVVDVHGDGLAPAQRLANFVRGLRSVIAVHPPLAINWWPAQHIVKPEAVLAASPDNELYLAFNVRFWSGDGKAMPEGVFFMDTRGLEYFGLWDLEARYMQIDPGHMARCLSTIAMHLWKGSEFKKHDTITGLGQDPKEDWHTYWGRATLGPDRPVLRIMAGACGVDPDTQWEQASAAQNRAHAGNEDPVVFPNAKLGRLSDYVAFMRSLQRGDLTGACNRYGLSMVEYGQVMARWAQKLAADPHLSALYVKKMSS